MARSYVPASIQSIASAVGHLKGTDKPCPRRLAAGQRCLVKFGSGHIDYNSFSLYIKAISTAIEGVLAILTTGIADYSNYRKSILFTTLALFSASALPAAGLYKPKYSNLVGLAFLYSLMQCLDAVYQIIEASYIPIFMRSRATAKVTGTEPEEIKRKQVLAQGSLVSVMGIVIGNIGGITALLIGVIITYSWGTAQSIGYRRFLLAVTIAGVISMIAVIISAFIFPSVRGIKKPDNTNIAVAATKRLFGLVKDIRRYPEAWKLCIGWVIWNVSYSNFLSVFMLLFRSELGLGSTDGEYTVWTLMTSICATLGSLGWMYAYPRTSLRMIHWVYGFMFISFFSNLWGCIGIPEHVTVGYKHRAEFWVFEIFYAASSSALRSLNRTLYSSLLPEGSESKFFGLEITMGVAVGWIGSLVNASIQNRTGNLRWPMVPNLFLVLISLGIYTWVDIDKGMRDADKINDVFETREPSPEVISVETDDSTRK